MEIITKQVVRMEHLNHHKNLFGGQMLSWLDEAAYMFCVEKTSYTNMVTVSLDKMSFIAPARLGDIIVFNGEVTEVGNSSIKISIKAVAVSPDESRELTTVLITFVMLDDEGKPYPLFKNKNLRVK